MRYGQEPPYKVAEDTLARLGISHHPVDVDKVAFMLDAEIVRTKSEGGESGFILRDGRRRIIGVNSGTSRKRQRFTIAHEIGHLLLHPGDLIVDSSIRVNYRDNLSSLATDEQEMQANKFGAALLMPKSWVQEAVARMMRSATSREEVINNLAQEFDVSVEAMHYRLINLGIVSA